MRCSATVSIRLETEDGRTLKINAWNWGVLHEIVAKRRLFPASIWAPKRGNGGGALEPDQVNALADFLEHEVLPYLAPGERLYHDGTVTNVPDDGTFHRDETELWRNYSLTHEVLADAVAFLRAARGPVSFF